MVFEMEKFTSRKSELESLLLLMEEREKILKNLIRTLTMRLQTRVLDKEIKIEDNILRHFDSQILIPKNSDIETVSDQYLKNPSLMAEPELNEIKKKLFNHRIRLNRNTTFSWSYQKLS